MTVNQVDEETGRPRVVLISGGNGVIGRAIARRILRHGGHEVVLACRTEQSGQEAKLRAQEGKPGAPVRYVACDLARRRDIFALAASFEGPLDVLINNAAASPPRRSETPDGIEVQFATNVLGYVWMMEAFAPLLSASRPSRIVNVASYWAGDLDLSDLEFKRRRYDNNAAYRQSKQANRMLSVVYAERFAQLGISVNACHPGDVSSKLSRDLGFGGSMTADDSAKTPAYLALDPAGERNTGKYFASERLASCEFSRDLEAMRSLDRICQAYR